MNGSCGLIETVPGGESLINRGAQSLLKLSEKIDKKNMRNPAFLMVLCAAATLPASVMAECLPFPLEH